MIERIEFFTDTAEVCVFDPDCLRHRLQDAADWWTVPSQALLEMNAGNVMFVDVGDDGEYVLDVDLAPAEQGSGGGVESLVSCLSGRLFVGPAEETTGGEVEPDPSLGGRFFEIPPGTYRVRVAEKDAFHLAVSVRGVGGPPENRHSNLLRLIP